jgi:hypothetical protein
MTQEQSRRRRYNRTDRNRPVLVTSSTATESETSPDNTEIEQIETVEETPVVEEAPATPQKTRRLPSFFSTVGRKTTEETPEVDVAQARLARATRKAGASTAKATDAATTEETQEKQETKPKPTPARTAATRPISGFKTRYLLGMVIYLLGANFIGVFESQAMASAGLNHVLTTFDLFGGKVIISTSTIVFLATLIILLIVLAKFDLIPRSLSAMTGQPEPARRGQTSNRGKTTDQETSTKTPPPVMRQGVKGEDDDLYEEYRANQRYMQRRARKRS